MGKVVQFDPDKKKNYKRVTSVEKKEPTDLHKVKQAKKAKEQRKYKPRGDYRSGFWEGLF